MLEITEVIKARLEHEYNVNYNISASMLLNNDYDFNSVDDLKKHIEKRKESIPLFLEVNDFNMVQSIVDEIKEYVRILEIFGCEDYSKPSYLLS